MSKTNVIVALSAVIVTFLTMAILGAVLFNDEPSYDTSSQIQQEAESAFISSCRGENPPEGFCTCAWDELTDVYSINEILEMGQTDRYPDGFYDARNKCLTRTNAQQI